MRGDLFQLPGRLFCRPKVWYILAYLICSLFAPRSSAQPRSVQPFKLPGTIKLDAISGRTIFEPTIATNFASTSTLSSPSGRTIDLATPRILANQTSSDPSLSVPVSVLVTGNNAAVYTSRTAGFARWDLIEPEATPVSSPSELRTWHDRLKTAMDKYDASYRDVINAAAPSSALLSKTISNGILYKEQLEPALTIAAADALQRPSATTFAVLHSLDDQIASLKGEVSNIQRNKSAYGPVSVYPLSQYSFIVTNGRSVGKIQHVANRNEWGTCVHIGGGRVITAAHVIPEQASAYEAQFQGFYSNVVFGLELVTNFLHSPAALDLTLCRLKATPAELANLGVALPYPAIIQQRIPCLPQGKPLYVIGYPTDRSLGLAVHDDCHVVFPRWSDLLSITTLFGRLTASDRLKDCKRGEGAEDLLNRIKANTTSFLKIYGYSPTNRQTASLSGYTAHFDGMEIMGFDSDTTAGTSGGAVFDKETGYLVAINLGGIPDYLSVEEADISYFERGLPVESFWALLPPP